MRIIKFSIFVLALLVLSAGIVQAGSQTFTGCLTKGGAIIKVAIGDAPARPCTFKQEQISWTFADPLVNFSCGEGTAISGFDEDGLPICECFAPYGAGPNNVMYDQYWDILNVSINGGPNFATIASGEQFTVSIDYTHDVIPACPGCIIQFQLGFSHLEPEPCLLGFGFAPLNGSGSTTFTAPMEPGVYFIDGRRTLELSCLTTWEQPNPGGTNWPRSRVAAICVK